MIYDVLIIGAGVIGGMAARELSRSQLSVCLLEKENDVACGATRANSGIIHGGYDPEPGTLKATLNTAGVSMLYEAARQLHVPHVNNGSLVCAFSQEEDAAVWELYDRGIVNGISGLKVLTGDEARILEPELSGAVTSALHIPTAGIICPYELTIAAVGNAIENGVELRRNFAVSAIQKQEHGYAVTSATGETVKARYILNCAGGYADAVARMVGDDYFTIIPRSGEYILLDKQEGSRVRHTIFQVPSVEGKGILVSPTVDGNLLTGPTASGKSAIAAALAREMGAWILSADSMLVYRGMDIGTAKPEEAERREFHRGGVDIVTPADEYSSGEYLRAAARRGARGSGRCADRDRGRDGALFFRAAAGARPKVGEAAAGISGN